MATTFDRDDGQFDKIEKSDKNSKDDNDVTGRRSCVFLLFLAMFLSCFMGYFVPYGFLPPLPHLIMECDSPRRQDL